MAVEHSETGPEHRTSDHEMIDHAARQVEQARQRMEGTRTSPSPPAQSKDIPEPGSIPGYEILRKIERGGQGVVYRAIQEGTKREVAIKVMREGPFAGSGDKARFEREIQVLGQLNHPNIVTVHHSGSASSGHFYYVMDYVDGQPLDAWSAEKERPVDETLRLFLKICDAVNAAHVRGIIHRDLKPSNIRVDPDGEPQVMDFGLAKLATPDATDEALPSVTTLSGQFVGSLPWASPEQAEGAPGKIDIRTDVYSLGVILYQMLTGRFPYDVTGSLRDVLTNIIDAEPVKPRTVRRQMHDDVETIVLQCLDKDRDGRYQSAGELARDIRRYLNGEPIDPKHHKLLYVIGKTLTRHWRQCSVAAAAALLVIIGGYLAIGEFQAMRARSNAARLARLDSWLNDMRWWFDSGQYKSAIRYADRVLADHPDHFEARVLRIQALRNQGRDEDAEDEARSLQAKHPENAVLFFLLSKLTEDSKPDESAAFHRRGQSLVKEDPEQYYLRALINENDDEAIELLNKAIDRDPSYFEALLARAYRYYRKEDYVEARIDARSARSLRPYDWRPWHHLGYISIKQENYARAVTHLERVVELKPDAERAWFNLGLARKRLGDLALAESAFIKAIELDPSEGRMWVYLGLVQYKLEKTGLARESFQHVINLEPKRYDAVVWAGRCEERVGNHDVALQLYRRSAELDGAELLVVYGKIGKLLTHLGRGAEALAAYDEALREDPGNPSVLNNVAWVHLTDPSPSVRDLKKGLQLARHVTKKEPKNRDFQGVLAMAELKAKDFDAALERVKPLIARKDANAWVLLIGSWAAFECGDAERTRLWRARAEELMRNQSDCDRTLPDFMAELDVRIGAQAEGG